MENESDHVESHKANDPNAKPKTEGEAEKQQIDLVVRWRMTKIRKQGFISLFGVQLLKEKNQISDQGKKLVEYQQLLMQKTHRMSQQTFRQLIPTGEQLIVPIKVTYDYTQLVNHQFS